MWKKNDMKGQRKGDHELSRERGKDNREKNRTRKGENEKT